MSAPSDVVPDDAPGTSLASLRAVIDAKLRDEGIYSQLRSLLHEHATANLVHHDGGTPDLTTPDHDDNDRLLHTLLESDVVQQLIASIQPPPLSSPPSVTKQFTAQEATAVPSWSHQGSARSQPVVVHVRVLGGRAFVDNLVDIAPPACSTPSESAKLMHRTCLRFDVAFQNQRFQSQLVDCVVDPPFDETMAFSLQPPPSIGHSVAMSKWESLCAIQESIHWTITKHVQTSPPASSTALWTDVSVELVAAAALDWRQWLTSPHPVVHIPLTLQGPMKVPVGVLNLRVDIPAVHKTTATTHDAKLYLQKETISTHGTQSHLYQYCKHWWADYLRDHRNATSTTSIVPSSSSSSSSSLATDKLSFSHWIRLFVEDDTQRYKLVCTYVTPLRSLHLSTPSEAARFVSLLPFVRASHVGSGRDATWQSLAAFLALGHGDCEEHAILLASLLLGFGLEAYVCMGTIRRSTAITSSSHDSVRHVWVATMLTSGVVLWEAVTGECVAASAAMYDRVDCVFNHQSFYANCQDRIEFALVDWTVENPQLWKALDPALIAQVGPRQPSVALRPPVTMTDDAATDRALRHWLQATRAAHGLHTTRWHPDLSHYIRMALTSYEVERVFGSANVDNVYFQVPRTVCGGGAYSGMG
ncbi:hypothetical protein, variant [Aphanomyces astaci]|uniref:Centrosomal protein of 76 kDa n=1 Tax=Aphanomyces astaci TaxID=112090 RepID=W4FIP8_APHAT|nr:hypothetical protein, variant [Aphanomyces astaci]ETV67392.1 hypothetical protein, variant [Aphanomyces astaci]|eukprot:XP_009843207.1 hypothetical protein, variant [Aphanomyces astaci]